MQMTMCSTTMVAMVLSECNKYVMLSCMCSNAVVGAKSQKDGLTLFHLPTFRHIT